MNEIDTKEVFNRGPSQGVEFEILFAGVMASMLIAVSGVTPILDGLSVLGALFLLILTMVRRMALENDFAAEKPIMASTLYIIFFISAFGLTYLSIFFIEMISDLIGLNYWIALPIFLFTITYIFVAIYEVLFRDFMLWSAILFYNRARKHSFGINFVKRTLFLSRIDNNQLPEQLKSISEQEDRSPISIPEGIVIAGVILAIATIIFLAVGTVAVVFLNQAFFQLIVVSLAAWPLLGLLEFWFSRHGNADFGKLANSKVRYVYFVVVASTAYLGYL